MTKTPAEHAAAAEELLAVIGKYDLSSEEDRNESVALIQLAQVHATLATITPALNWSRGAKSEASA